MRDAGPPSLNTLSIERKARHEMNLALLRKGLGYLRRGEFAPISRYVRYRAGRGISRRISDLAYVTFDDASDIPDWVHADGPVTISQVTDYTYHEIFISLDLEERDPIEIDVPEEGVGLAFTLIGTHVLEEVELEFEQYADAELVERSTQTYSGDTIGRARGSHPRSLVPGTLELESGVDRVTMAATRVERNIEEFSRRKRVLTDLATQMGLRATSSQRLEAPNRLRTSVPAVRTSDTDKPPVFVITVDSLRYDFLAQFDAVLDALGENAVVPGEPRTQGYWTRPSLASIITGVHPTTHGYHLGSTSDIDPELPTLGEHLAQAGYTNSVIETRGGLSSAGFARGIHRFCEGPMNYNKREHDASFVVNKLCDWVDADTRVSDQGLFYFAHVLDPHFPFLPPAGYWDGMDPDGAAIEPYLSGQGHRGHYEYLADMRDPPSDIDPAVLDQVRDMYERSLASVADQLVRFVDTLKRNDLFEDSLIVISGDHGEEFMDHGVKGHDCLYDTVIKPGFIVKPPAGSGLPVPDDVDTIDLYPTIAELAGTTIPDHCQGHSFGETDRPDVRITEGYVPEYYSVAAELDGVKLVTIYEHDAGSSPSDAAIADGPVERLYFRRGQSGPVAESRIPTADVSQEVRDRLIDSTDSFVRAVREQTYSGGSRTTPSPAVDERLQELGYK